MTQPFVPTHFQKNKLMKKTFLSTLTMLCLLVFATNVQAQVPGEEPVKKTNTWKTLGKITFKKQYDEMLGFKVDVPVFSPAVKALAGEIVTIRGYIIPVEGYKSHNEFIFSAYPYNMCFFCGGAGPETVMEVVANEPIEYTAEAITIRGKLETNEDDINRLLYALTEAELVEED
ncbi:MAG: hypothetical protein ACI9XO_000131 [Paraglaciecola sp.]|jgi:hypothetical protein